MELMQEFNFEIQYVKGKENVVADTLSRRPFLNAVSFVKDTILDQIKGGYKDDVFFSIPFESLSKEARTQEEINKFSTYALDANILYYKSRICVPEVGDYRKNIIYDCHNIPISGHPGFQKTYAVVKKYYFWPGLKRDVKDHVEKCLLCQTNKVEQVKHPGLLQPLSVPNRKWESISMDFIVDLPKTQKGFDSIFVVVDRLTKVARFIPTVTTVTASGVAELFFKEIFGNYGLPREIICDRDRKFVSEFWKSLFKLCGTKINMSSAYHPETNGQTERTNRSLEDMLRMYVGKRQQSWDKWLYLIQFAYNQREHSSIGMSPFYALYGQECRTPISLATPNSKIESLNQMIREMHSVLECARQCMQGAQERSKHYADQRRSVREFEVGQKVFLKVTPKRSGLKLGRSRKLSPRFCGPFQIIKRVGQVAYALDLPKDWKIHNIFHVSLLRRYVSDPAHVLPDLPQVAPEGEMLAEPERILQVDLQHLRNRSFRRFLIKWKDYPEDEASWELENEFKETYPNFVIADNDLN
jgi:hypothetical protein